jgi:DNA-binding transcriptional LysR family regulator
LRIRQLRYFCTVCREGSIANAAKILFVSEPTISLAIHELEDEYGLPLFYREKKRMFLTKEGEIVYERAKSLISHFDDVDEEMRELAKKHHPVRIGVSPFSAILTYLPLSMEFEKKYPDIVLEMSESGSTESMNELESKRLDCAFVVENQRSREYFDSTTMLNTKMAFCINKNHRLAGKEVLHLSELANENMVLPRPDSFVTSSTVWHAFGELGISPNISVSTRNIAFQVELLKKNAYTSTIAMKEFENLSDEIVAVPIVPELPVSVVFIRRKGDTGMTTEAAKFIRFVQKYAAANKNRDLS